MHACMCMRACVHACMRACVHVHVWHRIRREPLGQRELAAEDATVELARADSLPHTVAAFITYGCSLCCLYHIRLQPLLQTVAATWKGSAPVSMVLRETPSDQTSTWS